MTSTLSSLPTSVLGQILGFDDSSHLSLLLFRVGNKRITEQLQQGVTYIELRNEAEFDVCYMPWFITHLPSLRHLVIDRSGGESRVTNERSCLTNGALHPVSDRLRSIFVVQGLPKEMESIIFRFDRSMDIFFPTDDIHPFVNPGKAFPSLKRLHLDHLTSWTKDYLLDLPPSLTSLKITLPDHKEKETKAILDHLPQSLLHLAIVCRDDSDLSSMPFYEKLPPRLQSLALLGSSNADDPESLTNPNSMTPATLEKIPRSLVSAFYQPDELLTFIRGIRILNDGFNLPGCDTGITIAKWQPATGAALPPHIASLIIQVQVGDKLTNIIAGLPTHLTSLQLQGNGFLEPKHIRALPRVLTTLTALFKTLKGLKAGDFPATLRTLEVVSSKNDFSAQQLSLLPALTNLQCNAFLPIKSFSGLPQSITNLKVLMDELSDELLPLPKSLLHLEVIGAGGHLFGLYDTKNGISKVKKPKSFDLLSDGLPKPESVVVARTFRISWLKNFALKTLKISGFPIPFSDLMYLPASLTRLHLGLLCYDTLYGSHNKELMVRVAEMVPDYDELICLWGPTSQVSMLDWLPKDLTHLSLSGHMDVPPYYWDRLPQHIEYLRIMPTKPVERHSLEYLPLQMIRGLAIHVEDIEDDEFQLIPMRLRHLEVKSPAKILALTKHISYNNNLFLFPEGQILHVITERLQDKRQLYKKMYRDPNWDYSKGLWSD